jgi:carbonic anhydrase/acetyltransferase-like protein (isoleucine patch superfamily)
LIGDVEIGEEASIWFGVVIRADHGLIHVGARTNVQDNAVIHVSDRVGKTMIGDDVTIGHCAVMEDCVIGDGALIGTNSVILNGAKIGSQALIAAGSVVAADAEIPPRVVVAGAPAKVKKTLEGDAVNWVTEATQEYVVLSRAYRQHDIGDPSAMAVEKA